MVHSPDRTEGHPLFQRDRVLPGPQVLQILLVAQRQPQCLDLRSGTMTDIGNRAVEDLAVSTIGLAQQMPRIRFATTGDMRGIDIHSGYYNNIFIELNKGNFLYKLNL